MNNEEGQKESKGEPIVTPKTIDIYSEFAVTLKHIHTRLIALGYTNKDGVITPPKLFTEKELPPKKSRGSRKRRVVD